MPIGRRSRDVPRRTGAIGDVPRRTVAIGMAPRRAAAIGAGGAIGAIGAVARAPAVGKRRREPSELRGARQRPPRSAADEGSARRKDRRHRGGPRQQPKKQRTLTSRAASPSPEERSADAAAKRTPAPLKPLLWHAIESNNVTWALELIGAGYGIEEPYMGCPPLAKAAEENCVEVVESLLEARANVLAKTPRGQTASALARGRRPPAVEVLKLLEAAEAKAGRAPIGARSSRAVSAGASPAGPPTSQTEAPGAQGSGASSASAAAAAASSSPSSAPAALTSASPTARALVAPTRPKAAGGQAANTSSPTSSTAAATGGGALSGVNPAVRPRILLPGAPAPAPASEAETTASDELIPDWKKQSCAPAGTPAPMLIPKPPSQPPPAHLLAAARSVPDVPAVESPDAQEEAAQQSEPAEELPAALSREPLEKLSDFHPLASKLDLKPHFVAPSQVGAALAQHGFALLEDAISPAACEAMRARCASILEQMLAIDTKRCGNRGEGRYSIGAASLSGQQLHHAEWSMLLSDTVLDALDNIFGVGEYVLRGGGGEIVLGGVQGYQDLHADVSRQPPHCDTLSRPPLVVVNFAVHDILEDHGPTRLLPARGRPRDLGKPPTANSESNAWKRSVLAPLRAGACVVRDARIWHGGTPNFKTQPRFLPNLEFYSREFAQFRDAAGQSGRAAGSTMPPEVFAMLSPRARLVAKDVRANGPVAEGIKINFPRRNRR
eukprot:TRINITY_DN1552_c0_g5_i1.p1 TRINITY_DN1552_c0_g5~~TRINITY_DN1552_c0_g5_i1.p1  ORF type:complete len:725 (-),score=161.18 TRINITY_DN1552_c0_g5_i1:11-2185(-)